MKRLLLSLLTALVMAPSSQGNISVVGALTRTATAAPGGTFEGIVFLANKGRESADVRVSQTDYLFSADGSNVYGDPGTSLRSNASWLTVSPKLLKLKPGETQPVHYRGRVPADRNLRGTYWSMLMVEPNDTPPITPDSQADKVSVGLKTTIRFAVQIITEVGHDGVKSLKVLEKSLVQTDDTRLFQLDIANDGEEVLIPAMNVELFDEKGASVGRFDAGRSRIYPACSVRAKVDLSGVPAGKYAALVVLDSGDAQVMGAQYELQLQP